MTNFIDIYATKLVFKDDWIYIEKHVKQYAKRVDENIIDLLDCKELALFGTDLEEFLKIKNTRPSAYLNHTTYVFDTPFFDLFFYFLMNDD